MRMFIKPFSVNGAWKGRRRRTDRYNSYEELLLFTLPNFKIPKGRLSIEFEFGFKNNSSDVDNPIKPFLDILQKKYGFNDNMVYRIIANKIIVKSGSREYVDFKISSYKK